MAVTQITVGEAFGPEISGKKGKKGDQKQPSSSNSDFSGEVRMTRYSTNSFLNLFKSDKNKHYKVYRLIDPNEASTAAELMIRACNNPNIGYSQEYSSDDPDENRTGIFKRGVDSTVPINCDCSSLASYCAYMATGVYINGNSSGIGNQLKSSGKCMPAFYATELSFPDNPPYNGDIFVRSVSDTPAGGHVFLVVAGNPREGKEDEVVTSSWTSSSPSQYIDNASLIIQGDDEELRIDAVRYEDQFGNTFDFVPRTIEPASDNYFYNADVGTNSNSAYAWGRFREILQSNNCNLYRGEAKKWYLYKEDSYKREVAPCVGAVMCYTNIKDNADPGLVCIVERIEKDEIFVSQRSIRTGEFEVIKKEKKNGSWDMDLDGDGQFEYVFQGFIYNPSVDIQANSESAQDKFVDLAKAQVGSDEKYTEKYTKKSIKNTAWSAAFIVAVAKQCGSLLNIIVPNTFSCSDIGRIGVIRNMGKWLAGPRSNRYPEPKVGDIALFRTSDFNDRANMYGSDKAGIIVEVSSASSKAKGTNQNTIFSFKVVMGDCSGKVALKSYTTDSRSLWGIFRPNWEQVDGTTQSVKQYSKIEGLYTEGTSLEDAAIRDLRYVNLTKTGFEPSIRSSGLLLCAINYTGMLANLYSAFAEVSSSSATDADLVVDLWNNSVKSRFQDDSYPMITLVGESVDPSIDPSTQINIAANSTMNTGGSVTTTASTYVESPNNTASLNTSHDISVSATATFYEKSITKTIVLNNIVRIIYEMLNSEIANPAGTIGIMANMFEESGFDCSSMDTETKGCGLIHWTDTNSKLNGQSNDMSNRCSKMKAYCRNNRLIWKDNLEGQIKFIFNEAATVSILKTGMDSIKKVSQDIGGAVRSTRLFLDYFIMGGLQHQGEIKEVESYNIRSCWARALWALFFGGKISK